MPFLYGNHVVKAHLGKTTEDITEHQGVVVYSMNDIPLVSSRSTSTPQAINWCLGSCHLQGFGVTARSTIDTRKTDPTAIIVFNQAFVSLHCPLLYRCPKLHPNPSLLVNSDVGEYLRDEVSFLDRIENLTSFTSRILILLLPRITGHTLLKTLRSLLSPPSL